ncbi:MAG: ABC transporter substrate-binding protein [Armatimonadota bacterium]
MRNVTWAVIAAVAIAVVSLAGTAVGQARGGTLKILIIVDSETGMDPHKRLTASTEIMLETMHETLVEFESATGEFKPDLAESWQISQDGRTYTFKIRRGVRFHNGREMTATDVKYSFERILNPATGSPRRLAFSPIDRIEAPDATTVVFSLKAPFAPFLANMAHIGTAIVPREAVEAGGGDLSRNSVGVGPFAFKEWVRDNYLRVERNPTYWRRGLPYLDGIEFRFNSDPNARFAAFRSGQVNFLYKIDKPFVRALQNNDLYTVVGGQSSTYAYLYFNITRPPFNDVRVRQAVSWAMDRDAIRANALLKFGVSLPSGFLPPDHWGALRESIYGKQDLDRARQLLSEAGFRGGRYNITVVTITPPNVRAAETLQQQLRPLGFDIEVRVLEPAPMLRAAFSADFDMLILHGNFGIDPDDHLSQTFLTGGGANWVKYSDSDLDNLVAQARVATTRSERARLYRDIMRRLATQGPRAYMYLEADFHAFPNNLRGYRFDPAPSFRSLREAWFAPQ